MAKALTVLSGGQDSTTCLFWSTNHFGGSAQVEAITFDYGQRHRIELESARKVASIAKVKHAIVPINTFSALGGDSLTDDSIEVPDGETQAPGLPNTFVPGRNLIFLTFAAAFAYRRGIRHLITGVAQTDYSGYPDCRENTIKAVNKAINLGMDYDITIHTPLMHKSKAETVRLASDLGALEALAWTHTCYKGVFPPCGRCPACRIRRKGFTEAAIEDPLWARANNS